MSYILSYYPYFETWKKTKKNFESITYKENPDRIKAGIDQSMSIDTLLRQIDKHIENGKRKKVSKYHKVLMEHITRFSRLLEADVDENTNGIADAKIILKDVSDNLLFNIVSTFDFQLELRLLSRGWLDKDKFREQLKKLPEKVGECITVIRKTMTKIEDSGNPLQEDIKEEVLMVLRAAYDSLDGIPDTFSDTVYQSALNALKSENPLLTENQIKKIEGYLIYMDRFRDFFQKIRNDIDRIRDKLQAVTPTVKPYGNLNTSLVNIDNQIQKWIRTNKPLVQERIK